MKNNKTASGKGANKRWFFSIIKWTLAVVGLAMVCASRAVNVPNWIGQIGAWMMVLVLVFSIFNVWEWMEKKFSHD